MADSIQSLSRLCQQLSETVKENSDMISRIDERIKAHHDQYELLLKEVESIKESNIEVKGKLIAVDAFLARNISDRMIKMEEEQKSYMHECTERTASLNEIIKEVRAIIRDGQGTMPSILARLIMVENSIKRLTEIGTENRSLIEDNAKIVKLLESSLIRMDWSQQSIQGKIGIVANLFWKIAMPIIGALILWKLGLK